MKKISYYTFIMCTIVILSVSIVNITNLEITKQTESVDNSNLSKFHQSSIFETTEIMKEIEDEYSKQVEDVKGKQKEQQEKQEQKQVEKKEEVKQEIKIVDNYSAIDTSGHTVLETYTGTISYYGPDCVGCSGRTASGYNISSQATTYKDPTYGNVRIVAGDYKYPFGTIVRFTYQSGQTELAILLDRGGVGLNKKYQFDLLVASEKESYQRGVRANTKIEILRSGY